MELKDTIQSKEVQIRKQLDELRNQLNAKRIIYNTNPQGVEYFLALTHTENKLKDLLTYFTEE